jgi:hypothetical protein
MFAKPPAGVPADLVMYRLRTRRDAFVDDETDE